MRFGISLVGQVVQCHRCQILRASASVQPRILEGRTFPSRSRRQTLRRASGLRVTASLSEHTRLSRTPASRAIWQAPSQRPRGRACEGSRDSNEGLVVSRAACRSSLIVPPTQMLERLAAGYTYATDTGADVKRRDRMPATGAKVPRQLFLIPLPRRWTTCFPAFATVLTLLVNCPSGSRTIRSSPLPSRTGCADGHPSPTSGSQSAPQSATGRYRMHLLSSITLVAQHLKRSECAGGSSVGRRF